MKSVSHAVGTLARSAVGTAVVNRVRRHPLADGLIVVDLELDGKICTSVLRGHVGELDVSDVVAVVSAGSRMPVTGEKIRARSYRGIKSSVRILSHSEIDPAAVLGDDLVKLPQLSAN